MLFLHLLCVPSLSSGIRLTAPCLHPLLLLESSEHGQSFIRILSLLEGEDLEGWVIGFSPMSCFCPRPLPQGMIILFESSLASVSLIAMGATLTPGSNWIKAMHRKRKSDLPETQASPTDAKPRPAGADLRYPDLRSPSASEWPVLAAGPHPGLPHHCT